jgi:hypothetical protein
MQVCSPVPRCGQCVTGTAPHDQLTDLHQLPWLVRSTHGGGPVGGGGGGGGCMRVMVLVCLHHTRAEQQAVVVYTSAVGHLKQRTTGSGV